ncbi:MAG TPA: RimK family alpha-L-glutamate ligase [Methanothrix sp.]|nr:RimK family alpha-L-glutamate ligase [Methanothrix sp.]HQE87431.1 RimK family alpha-L-glutamate ligase [Methanothrix sp.]HQI67605.1 RimK family alpha-L-glutamate ligase [Methanothrix sp.]HRT16808.1 RimK family alpha-L-glutamate ligase [Methanothrix sp.]
MAVVKCRDVAERMGHTVEFIFPVDIKKIPKLDALFIRANTDPMNATYVAARMAEMYNVPVIDDPASIRICADKINMYMHLMKNGVSMPKTRFLKNKELDDEEARQLFAELGEPLILKEPSTSFSARVEKVSSPEELFKVARRFFKLSDWIVVQEYIESRFDWRIGIINGQLLYACRYIIPSETFKIQASVNGHIVYCDVESVPAYQVPAGVIELGKQAGNAMGRGLYGVDIKESNEKLYVIEVNDNPSLEGGEDAHYPDMFAKIISYLMTGDATADELPEKAMRPHGFEGGYGLGEAAAVAHPPEMADGESYSYKIDFSEH